MDETTEVTRGAAENTEAKQFPQGSARPAPGDIVQVLMTESLARSFEERCLGKGNTHGETKLSPPLKFSADDLPTYIIEVGADDLR